MELSKSSQFDIPLPLSNRYTKFLMTSKDGFEIEVTTSSGKVWVNVASDPDKLDSDPIWSLTQSIGTGKIRVAADDPNF